MGQNTKKGPSQGTDWLNVNHIELIAHIEPGPTYMYLEKGFSTGDPGPGIRFQWILRLRQLAKGSFLVYHHHYCECAK